MKFRWMTVVLLMGLLVCSACHSNKDDHSVEDSSVENSLVEQKEDSLLSEADPKEELTEEMESQMEITGEGVPVPIEVDLTEGEYYSVKDSIALGQEQGALYELTIEDVVYTDQRDEYAEDPGYVILVTYTYDCLSEQAVYIDDMSFQMMDENNQNVLDAYYLSTIQVPEPIEQGNSCTAQLAFSTKEKLDSVVLVYHDIVHEEIEPVKIAINQLQ